MPVKELFVCLGIGEDTIFKGTQMTVCGVGERSVVREGGLIYSHCFAADKVF
jgi:hypothetical protein